MGDLETTEQWFRRYAPIVFRRCMRLLGYEGEAWDATQEVFVRAHRHAARFRGDTSVLSWLLTIADRYCISLLRTRHRRGVGLEAMATIQQVREQGASDLELILTRSRMLGRVVAAFPPDIQEVVTLRYLDDLEQEEIAARLGISRKTVQRRLDRFVREARRMLGLPADASSQEGA